MPVLFVETICDDPAIIDANVRHNKLGLPDYAGMSVDEAFRDFQARIAQYARAYVPVDDDEGSYVKLVDAGRQVISNRIEGYLPSRLVFFLMQIRPTHRPIWLSRHGESEFNVAGRIGGDAPLTERGREYAERLAEFVRERAPGRRCGRAPSSARSPRPRRWVTVRAPGGRSTRSTRASATASPTRRSGRGCPRSSPRGRGTSSATAIPGANRMRTSSSGSSPSSSSSNGSDHRCLIVGHQAVIRALYGYLMGKPQDECPHLQVPLHTVIELTPTEYDYREERFAL